MLRAAGVVLAAGAGTRFGGPKALVTLDGERLVDRAVATLRGGGCAEVLVVSGAAPLPDVEATVVHNPDWGTGMGSSLRVSLRRLAAGDAEAAVVLLVDTPWVGAGAVARLLDAAGGTGMDDGPLDGRLGGRLEGGLGGRLAAQATYGGAPGHPVLLARRCWDAVAADAVADRGARAWLRAHGELVLDVTCDGTGDPRDVDRPADLLAPPASRRT